MDVEAALAHRIVRRAIFVGPMVVLGFGLVRGWLGAVSAALGIAMVVGNFLVSGMLLSRALKVSLNVYHAAALFGFLVRLGLITGTLLLLAALVELDRLALGLATVGSYFVLLTWEAAMVAAGNGKEYEWTR